MTLVLDFDMYMPFRAFGHSGEKIILVQRTQTGRGKFISNINDHLGLKPTASMVTISTRENAFGSITLEVGTKERWIFEGKK